MKKIEIMGCGYIGLPTAVTFTLAGYEVCGFDINETVVRQLNAGQLFDSRLWVGKQPCAEFFIGDGFAHYGAVYFVCFFFCPVHCFLPPYCLF